MAFLSCPHIRRDEEDDLLDDRDLSDDENGNGGMQMAAMDGSEAFHQVVKDMLLNGHQASDGPRAVPMLLLILVLVLLPLLLLLVMMLLALMVL